MANGSTQPGADGTQAAPVVPRPAPAPPSPAVLAGYLQAVPATTLNRNVIVLDPAHGGADSGAAIADGLTEKTVDLALANRLRSLLTARGFTVVMTRDSDAPTEPGNAGQPLTLDGRAAIANRSAAVACLLLHATAAGTGVHLYASDLDPLPAQPLPTPWLTAQAAWTRTSQQLAADLGQALSRSRIALVSSRASVRPMDSLTCPALVVELAPESGNAASINDDAYQQRVAAALAAALVFWPGHAQVPPRSVAGIEVRPAAEKSAVPHHATIHHEPAAHAPTATEVQP